jgi:hypothetical protein
MRSESTGERMRPATNEIGWHQRNAVSERAERKRQRRLGEAVTPSSATWRLLKTEREGRERRQRERERQKAERERRQRERERDKRHRDSECE